MQTYIAEGKLDEAKVMNWLQDNGWISDNAVTAEDVAEDEARRVVAKMKALKMVKAIRGRA